MKETTRWRVILTGRMEIVIADDYTHPGSKYIFENEDGSIVTSFEDSEVMGIVIDEGE